MATEKRNLIDRDDLIDSLGVSDMEIFAKEVIGDAPTVDAVSRGVHEQVRWERDVAIEQLESYGVSLGEKAEVAKVVRCKDCKHGIWDEEEQMWECIVGVDLNGDADTYAMFHEYNDGDHFCAYGERRGNA